MRRYFEGWYLKHQSETESLALIPSYHYDRTGAAAGSLQVITPEWSRQVSFSHFRFRREAMQFTLGRISSRPGAAPSAWIPGTVPGREPGLWAVGPAALDVMGPFRFVPGLQCRHSVFSLGHSVTGAVTVNGKRMEFDRATGYMEGDRGRSFPPALPVDPVQLGGGTG